MTDHADFLAADQEHRWTEPLPELGVFLRGAVWRAKGAWVYRILPGGACVAMRVIPEGEDAFKKELRVSRREQLQADEQLAKWSKECVVFRKHLGCDVGWHTQLIGGQSPLTAPMGYPRPTDWLTREDAALKEQPAKPALLCARCGKVAEPGSDTYKEVLCNACAGELGRAEAQARGH